MKVNFSVNHAATVFLAVLTLGSLWRLISFHLANSDNTQLQHLGLAMSFQY